MNKCLSLVYLTTNSLSHVENDRTDFVGLPQNSYEMNKCLTLVHLTSRFRSHSSVSRDSKARSLGPVSNSLLRRLAACRLV
jgi:hypothetical protein